MGICTFFITPGRIRRSAIAVAESTLLDFHRTLVSMKLQRLFSQKSKSRPGPKGPSRDLIKLVVEMKERNLDYGCPKIATPITNVTGHEIDAESVR
jgi:putative transposase